MSRHRDRHRTPPKRTWRDRYPAPDGPLMFGPFDVLFAFGIGLAAGHLRDRRRRRAIGDQVRTRQAKAKAKREG